MSKLLFDNISIIVGEAFKFMILIVTGGALKDAVVHMFGLQALFGSGTGETKKTAPMDFLKNAIGVGELSLVRDLVDEEDE